MQTNTKPKRVAIVGSGVTGLAASTVLDNEGVTVLLLERDTYIGGHCYTHSYVDPKSHASVDVDLGFMVLSPQTYNNFIEWVEQYGVDLQDTDMSFSACMPNGFAWSSNNPFADKSQLLSLSTLQLFWDLCRFEKICYDELQSHRKGNHPRQTVSDLQAKYGLSDAFMDYFLLPQCGSIWSMPAEEIGNIPSEFIIEFTYKHSLSCLWSRPVWQTVAGRSQSYVQKILDRHFRADEKRKKGNLIKTECTVKRLVFQHNGTEQIKVECEAETEELVVDHVLFCCHAKYALQILNRSNVKATEQEQRVLAPFEFGENAVYLHGVQQIMPPSRALWAAWNYHTSHSGTVNVTYWLNLLQNLPATVQPVFATLNPAETQRKELEKQALHVWHTQHPKYNVHSWRVIKDGALDRIQCVRDRHLSFAGAWTSFGFHRDGFLSGTKEAYRILGKQYKAKPIVIRKGSSYWFSYACCLLHQVIVLLLSLAACVCCASKKKRN